MPQPPSPPAQPVGVVSGGGWIHEHPDGNTVHLHPVIAWIVYSNGSALPLCAHEGGVSFQSGVFRRPDPAGGTRMTLQ